MPQSRPFFRWFAAPLVLALGCSGSGPVDGSVPDDAAPDAGGDVQSPDVVRADGGDAGADVGPGPDVAADGGGSDASTDGGPATYDLDQHFARNTLAIAFHAGWDYVRVTTPATCMIEPGGTLRFSAQVCQATTSTCATVFGDTAPGSDGGSSVGVQLSTGQASTAREVHVARGAVYSDAMGALQNFHFTFAAPAMGSIPAVTGIAGATADPALGEAWILGCAQQ